MTTDVLLFCSFQLGCMLHVSRVQNKCQISNHSCGTKYVSHVGFSLVNRYKLHILSKICLSIFNLQYWTIFSCLSPWKQFFLKQLYKALCNIACFSFISWCIECFKRISHWSHLYCMWHISSPKLFVYILKAFKYAVCVKGSHKKLMSSFLRLKMTSKPTKYVLGSVNCSSSLTKTLCRVLHFLLFQIFFLNIVNFNL